MKSCNNLACSLLPQPYPKPNPQDDLLSPPALQPKSHDPGDVPNLDLITPVSRGSRSFRDMMDDTPDTAARRGHDDDDDDDDDGDLDDLPIWLHLNSTKSAANNALQLLVSFECGDAAPARLPPHPPPQDFERGAFLVRSSKSRPGDYMLILCYDGGPHNFRIKTVGCKGWGDVSELDC